MKNKFITISNECVILDKESAYITSVFEGERLKDGITTNYWFFRFGDKNHVMNRDGEDYCKLIKMWKKYVKAITKTKKKRNR